MRSKHLVFLLLWPALLSLVVTDDVSGQVVESEKDLGIITYQEAPKTWKVDIPSDFAKVELGIYGYGEEIPNKYGGWNAYLKINGEYAWRFVRHDSQQGGIIYDYILGNEVLESGGRDRYLDATRMFHAGENTITYYHYTSGNGAGVKVKISTAPARKLGPKLEIRLEPSELELDVGEKNRLDVYVKNIGDQEAEDVKVILQLMDPESVNVDQKMRKLTSVSPGNESSVAFYFEGLSYYDGFLQVTVKAMGIEEINATVPVTVSGPEINTPEPQSFDIGEEKGVCGPTAIILLPTLFLWALLTYRRIFPPSRV